MNPPFNTKILHVISAITALNLGLLILRISIAHELLFLFLIWNLFLATIPLLIAAPLYEFTRMLPSKLSLWLFGIPWLLFLPNAFYIITDLKHLVHSSNQLIMLDALLIFSFAVNGLLLGFSAMFYMIKSIQICYANFPVQWVTILLFLLCGFSIYFGRELRWNSWDIVSNPLGLIQDIFNRIMHPLRFIRTWGITLIMGGFLMTNYYIFERFFMQKLPKNAQKD